MAKVSVRSTPADKLFAEQVRRIRTGKGISRRQVAEKMGISHQQFEKYENCQDRISTGKLVDIAKALEVGLLDVIPEELLQLNPINELCYRMWGKLSYDDKNILIGVMSKMKK